MGNETDKIDEFIETYGESKIESFCNGIKQNILTKNVSWLFFPEMKNSVIYYAPGD